MASSDLRVSSDDEHAALLKGPPFFKRKMNPQPTPVATDSWMTAVTPVVASIARTKTDFSKHPLQKMDENRFH
jgi:hypothetical protein